MRTIHPFLTPFFGGIFTLFFTPAFAFASTDISGTLSSDTILTSSGNPYILGYTTVPPGVTLTIEEGAVVKFADVRSALEVNGNLRVRGTETNPASFTSINDNTIGGTTGTGAPAQNDWGNIMVKEGGRAEIDHAVIRYGGYTGWQTSTASSNLYNRGGTLTLTNSSIGNSISGLTHASGTTTLEANIFSDNSQGIYAYGTGSLALLQNTFSNNTETAAYFDVSQGIAFSHSGNTATGGNQNGLHLRGVLNADYTFEKDTMPYIVGYLEIPQSKTVTARPGAVFKFASIGSQIRVSGKLNAEGTQTEPVYFTSIKDDAILGDTNGNTDSPAPTDWAEIAVTNGGTARFDHTIVRYGGQYSWGIWTNASNISNSGGTLAISNSDISNGNTGIRHLSGTTAIASSTISKNGTGVYGDGAGLLALTGNAFRDNGTHAYLDFSEGFTLSNSGNATLGTGDRGITIRGTLNSDQILEKDGAPYLVSYLFVPVGKMLTIRPGAVMKMASIGAQIQVSGTLDAIGTAAEPVYFTSIKDDAILGDTNGDENATTPAPTDWAEIAVTNGGTARFEHAVIRYGGQYSWGIWTNNAELANRGGTLDIANSEISYGNIGAYHQSGTTTVTQSSLHDNGGYGIYNAAPKTLHAENNWWGGPNGPYHPLLNVAGIGNNQVSNNVAFSPWLGYDPTKSATSPTNLSNPTETEDDNNQDAKGVADKTKFTFSVTASGNPDFVKVIATSTADTFILNLVRNGDTYTATSTFPKGKYTYRFEATHGTNIIRTTDRKFTTGYSNVAFLPGLEASRLYRPEILSGKTETKVWEPTLLFHDNSELFLDASGTPLRNNLYTRDPIDEVAGFNIYKSFLGFMDDRVADHTIHAWKPLPYDWRFDVRDIVDRPIALESGSYSMTEEIKKLAADSDTGKVTIIAHSNGGLVAKVLSNKLDTEAPKLLDQMIFVASPQAGTPMAVGAILHGYNQGIPKDWLPLLITPKDARDLAVNMPSAYGLLPSAGYFTHVDDPVITFDNDPLLADWRAKYGIEIHSSERLRNFLADTTRTAMPVTEETKNPMIGNTALLNSAEILHDTIDNWTPPQGVTLTQIAGWGEETLSKIVYYQGVKTVCADLADYSSCVSAPALEFSPKMVLDGDGTVVVPSALWTSGVGGRYWVDLEKYGKANFHTNINRKHADILEVEELRDFIKNIIVRNNAELPNFIKISAPGSDSNERLHFTLHSPLTLDLYDNLGNHTGISTTTGALEENIPGTRYRTFGEVKYISAPASTTLRLVMNGYATGSFTLDVEKVEGETVTASTTFAGIPSMTGTVAAIDIPPGGNIPDMSPLSVDIDGDGDTDLSLAPKENGIVTLPIFYRFDGFLQPINDIAYHPEQSASVFKGGSTVPVKFQIKNSSGVSVQSSIAPTFSFQKGTSASSSVYESAYSDPATSGNAFRWDSTAQQYIYNWSTKGITVGYWYKLFAKLDDGKTYSVTVGLR